MMRYDKRVIFKNDKGEIQNVVAANITNMGANQQSLVFGDVKQGRIIVRFYPAVNIRSGYFEYINKLYKITESKIINRRSIMYGVEYNGRL